MFNAYKADSAVTIISADAAKPLIEKLLLIDEYDKSTLEFEIGFKKYSGYSHVNNGRTNYQIFTEAQATKLSDFLNKNNIRCVVKESESKFYSEVYAGKIPHGLLKTITFPDLKNKQELIAKVNALYPDPAPQHVRKKSRHE